MCPEKTCLWPCWPPNEVADWKKPAAHMTAGLASGRQAFGNERRWVITCSCFPKRKREYEHTRTTRGRWKNGDISHLHVRGHCCNIDPQRRSRGSLRFLFPKRLRQQRDATTSLLSKRPKTLARLRPFSLAHCAARGLPAEPELQPAKRRRNLRLAPA